MRLLSLETLLAFASVSRRRYGRWRFQQLVPGILVVAGLVITIAMLISAAIASVFYGAFCALLHNGVGVTTAALLISLGALITLVLLVVFTSMYLRQLMHAPQSDEAPLASRAAGIVDAFLDGVMQPPDKSSSSRK